jgi:hypothetical protein
MTTLTHTHTADDADENVVDATSGIFYQTAILKYERPDQQALFLFFCVSNIIFK